MGSDAIRLIAVCHDIEAGWGHRAEDAAFARRADRLASRHLEAMLALEAEAGVRATYHVVARLLPRVRDAIARGGHCLGLHSYDHRVDRPQVARCRRAAPGITGYRPPQSRLTPELLDGTLVAHGFRWLASSVSSLGADSPALVEGLVTDPDSLRRLRAPRAGTAVRHVGAERSRADRGPSLHVLLAARLLRAVLAAALPGLPRPGPRPRPAHDAGRASRRRPPVSAARSFGGA